MRFAHTPLGRRSTPTLDRMEVGSRTLWGAAQAFWRSFAPAWLFPVVFLYGGLLSDAWGYPNLFFFLVAAPLCFWSFFRGLRPVRQKRVSYWHGVFWVMVVPFVIWVAAVLINLALTGRLHAA